MRILLCTLALRIELTVLELELVLSTVPIALNVQWLGSKYMQDLLLKLITIYGSACIIHSLKPGLGTLGDNILHKT